MQSSKTSTPKHNHFFLTNNTQYGKQHQVKSTKNLNVSLGSNQSLHSLNPPCLYQQNRPAYQFKTQNRNNYKYKPRQQHQNYLHNDSTLKLNSVEKQNQKLRQQNQILKKQLDKMKRQKNEGFNVMSKQKYRVHSRQESSERQSGADLRNTIKKQFQQVCNTNQNVKQLRIKLQILSKQCKMYQQINEKMQTTIRKLADQNILLKSKYNSQSKFSPNHNGSDIRRQQFQSLKQKVNLVMKQYSELQSKMHSNQLQWVIWKQQWITEKNIYLNRIRQLENKVKEKKQG